MGARFLRMRIRRPKNGIDADVDREVGKDNKEYTSYFLDVYEDAGGQ